MLVHDTILKDLRQLFSFLQHFDGKTDKRYSNQTGPILAQLGIIERAVKKELEYKDTLHKYKLQGFIVDKFEYKTYSRLDELDADMIHLNKAIQDVQPIYADFKSNINKVPSGEREVLEQLFRNPDTFIKAKQAWALLKGRLKSQEGEKRAAR